MKQGKKSQIQTDQYLLKLWPKIFYKKKSIFPQNLLNQWYKKKTLPQALVEKSTTKTKRQKKTNLQNIQENQSRAAPHPVEKKQSRSQTLAKKNKKENWEKVDSSLNRNTPINQACNRVRQLRGKDPKKVNIFEVIGAQYKDSKSTANKIGNISPNYLFHKIMTPHFQNWNKGKNRRLYLWTTPTKKIIISLSQKSSFSRTIQATKNSAPGPDKTHSEMLKHLPPEGLDSLLVLCNKIWQQGYVQLL